MAINRVLPLLVVLAAMATPAWAQTPAVSGSAPQVDYYRSHIIDDAPLKARDGDAGDFVIGFSFHNTTPGNLALQACLLDNGVCEPIVLHASSGSKGCDTSKVSEAQDPVIATAGAITGVCGHIANWPGKNLVSIEVKGFSGDVELTSDIRQVRLGYYSSSIPIWVAAIALLLAGGTSCWALRKVWNNRGVAMGSPSWDFSKSWIANLTVLGAVLTAALSANLPADDLHFLDKAGYAGMALFFTTLIIAAPVAYLLSQHGKGDDTKGSVLPYIIANGISLWAVFGQAGTLLLVLTEAHRGSGAWALVAAMIVLGLLVLGDMFYASNRMISTVAWFKQKAEEAKAADNADLKQIVENIGLHLNLARRHADYAADMATHGAERIEDWPAPHKRRTVVTHDDGWTLL